MNSFLVVGLGNPGSAYAGTRHNIGFQVLDQLAEEMVATWKTNKKTTAVETKVIYQQQKLLLAKPQTFMNNSGKSVQALLKFYSLPLSKLVIIHDELDLDFLKVRLKLGGGEGGHNGLRSISNYLGTKDYLRIRLGIGRPPGRQNPADYVLKKFSKTEANELPFFISQALEALEWVTNNDLITAQNYIHAKY